MQIQFFIPEGCLPPREEMPFWREGEPRRIEMPGKASTAQNWILLTYCRLANAGLPVRLCHSFPEVGLVVALTGNLPLGFKPARDVFLVGVVADGIPHPACQFHILQNAAHTLRLPWTAHIPHWPQPGLIPRDDGRGDRFENLVFFGDPPNLAPEIAESGYKLRLQEKFGLQLVLAPTGCWHDYSQADAVLAIRSFGQKPYLLKPATKLYNAWLAGVPFIGGSDTAFSSDGRPATNYLRCTSRPDLEKALGDLSSDPVLRRRLVAGGREAAAQFSPACILARWQNLLCERLVDDARTHFAKSPAAKAARRLIQRAWIALDRLRGWG